MSRCPACTCSRSNSYRSKKWRELVEVPLPLATLWFDRESVMMRVGVFGGMPSAASISSLSRTWRIRRLSSCRRPRPRHDSWEPADAIVDAALIAEFTARRDAERQQAEAAARAERAAAEAAQRAERAAYAADWIKLLRRQLVARLHKQDGHAAEQAILPGGPAPPAPPSPPSPLSPPSLSPVCSLPALAQSAEPLERREISLCVGKCPHSLLAVGVLAREQQGREMTTEMTGTVRAQHVRPSRAV